MGKKKTGVTVQQNRGKKPINPLIVFLAFLLGAAVAVFVVFWRLRASKDKKRAGASDRAADHNSAQTERELKALINELRSENERRERVNRRSDEKAVQAQKVKPYRPRRRMSAKRIFGRAVAVAVAAALVLTGLYLAPYSRITAPTVQAKERQSFSGIKQIVQDHEEDPFVILNIVPKKAVSQDGNFEISLGTIGYLAPGQSPIQQDLARIFKGEGKESLYPYSNRKKLTESLTNSVNNSGIGKIVYQEAYGGMGLNLNEWSLIFDQVKDVEHDEDGKLTNEVPYPTGRLWASVEIRETSDAETGDLPVMTGFDYKLVDGKFSTYALSLSATEGIYTFEAGTGDYEVIFEWSENKTTSGYRVEPIRKGSYHEALLGFGDMSDATGLYIVENGIYRYVSTIGEFKGISRPEPDEDKEKDPTPDDDEDDGSTLGDDGDDGGDDNFETIPGGGGDDETTPDGGGDDDLTPGDETAPGSDGDETSGDGGDDDFETIPGEENPSNESQLPASAFGAQSVLEMTGIVAGWHFYVNTAMTEPMAADPADQGTTPVDQGTTPVDQGTTPVDQGTTPVDQGTTPVDQGTLPEDQTDPADLTTTPTVPMTVPQSEMPEDGTYCVLKFTYVETEQEESLYQIREAKLISAGKGVVKPYDSYVWGQGQNLLRNSLFAADEDKASDLEPTGYYEYVGDGRQMYKLTKAQQPSAQKDVQDDEQIEQDDTDEQTASVREVSVDSGSVQYVEVQNAPVYIKCVSTNAKDWLKQYVFNSLKSQDNASDDFSIKVNTVFAADVTYEMVQEADLVYLEDGEGLTLGGENDDIWVNKYIKPENWSGDSSEAEDEDGSEDSSETETGDESGDISDVVITRLLYEAVEESKPVIVDYAIMESQDYPNGYAGSRYQTLAKVFLKKDLSAFYHEMAKKDNLFDNILMNVDKTKDFPNKTDNGNHYVNRNVYIVNGETRLVADDFHDEITDKTAVASGFSEVLAAIRAENLMLSEDDRIAEKISKAMAVQYIINYSLGLVGDYKDLSILELQPTANTLSDLHRDAPEDKERVVLYWQREDQGGEGQQILRSSKRIKTDVTTSSVAAFNSSYQDINTDYNMIFIGLDGQRLYRERDKEGELSAVYNNTALNGKVYHTGDSVAGSDARYDANDITEQKKEALLDYLQAGYPIVVENEFFKGKSARKAEEKDINTKYIHPDTQMYAFLKEAISMLRTDQSEETGETGIGIYTIEDVHTSAMFVMQLNTVRPKIELWDKNENPDENPEENNGDDSGEVQEPSDMIETVSVPEKIGVSRGTIEYRITSDRTGEDKTYTGDLERHLYFDLNYDGIFAEEEEIPEYEYEENEGIGKISVDFNEIDFGIVPWKLEVTDGNNKYRRAATQGYFTINSGNKAKIRLLQVLDDKTDISANFQEQFEQYGKTENYMLAYYLKAAETTLKANWKIETVTPDELAKRLDKSANYLSRWDVVALGFGESGNPGDAVTAAIDDYIAAGGSVVVSSAGASADKGRLGLSETVLGQGNGQTYGKLGLHSGSKYRYDISANLFDKTPSLYLDRINDGAITRWPYQIDMQARLGDVTEVSMADYLLDIGGGNNTEEEKRMGQPYTTAWFTLLDSDKNGAYSTSPRDGRNNYYVYSKGNVVYVGQSQYPYKGDAPSDKDKDKEDNVIKEPEGEGRDECKIFVNALIAAYNGGVHRANVSIVAGFNGVNKVESVTVPYDVAFKEGGDANRGILGETVDVYFRFTDNNIATDKKTEYAFYYKNPGVSEEAELLLADDAVNEAEFTKFESLIWSVEDNRLVEVTEGIVPGKVYRIKAPLVSMQNGDDKMSQICVLLTNHYTRAGQEEEAVSMDSVSLNRAQMFLLE